MTHVRELLDRPAPPAPDGLARTGFPRLDDVTGGLRAGDVWLVTGAPGQGRTTLVTQWAGALAARHGWSVWLGSPREEPHWCTSRLLASLGPLPLHALRTGRGDAPEPERHEEVRQQLREANLVVDAGRTVCLPCVPGHPYLHGVFVDDADSVIGAAPQGLRGVADAGALVVAALPRHLVTQGPDAEADLDPRWAAVADVIVEVRTLGLSPHAWERIGEADLTLLRNRRGPLAKVAVANQGHYARFATLAESADKGAGSAQVR